MIRLKEKINQNCLDTLKNTSRNSKNGEKDQFMCDSEVEVYNFDKVKEQYAKPLKLSTIPMSNDALMVDKEGNFVFVEFKNGTIDNKTKHDIKKKDLR